MGCNDDFITPSDEVLREMLNELLSELLNERLTDLLTRLAVGVVDGTELDVGGRFCGCG